MKIYNSLSGCVEEFERDPTAPVGMYSCGPTVYAEAHIGNITSFIHADTLRRALITSGYDVHHVTNFTDIDDKIIAKAQREHPNSDPMAALYAVTTVYEEKVLSAMLSVGVAVEDIEFIRATESIAAMQSMILDLLSKGFAYPADDGIYFDTQSYQDHGYTYGQLTNMQDIEDTQQRITGSGDKRSVRDFALWKKAQVDEPSWPFEINGASFAGRPGWHIECSAMSKQLLGDQLDIHTGGVDLKFPHHENEIAQSTASSGNPVYADVFSHNAHLTVDGHKMSKSLGNDYVLADIESQGYSALGLRMFVLSHHYRQPLDYTEESMVMAMSRLRDLADIASARFNPTEGPKSAEIEVVRGYIRESREALLNDLDTPTSMVALGGLAKHIRDRGGVSSNDVDEFVTMLQSLDEMFGFGLSCVHDIPDDAKMLIRARATFKTNKDFAGADTIRAELFQKGIELRDTPSGTLWSYITL